MSTPQSSSEVMEISISSDEEDFTEEPTWRRIHGVALSTEDKDCIIKGKWLNDKIVYAAMLLMKHDKDLLPVGSLQDPLYGQDLSFQAAEGQSVQILHSGGNHWITVSTIDTTHNTVRVYDSLYSQLPWTTKEQIAALIATKEKHITLEYANVQVRT